MKLRRPSRAGLTRPRVIIATVAAVIVVGATSGGVALAQHDDLPADAVFRYAGTTVTERQLDDRVDVLSALYGVQKPTKTTELAVFHRDAAKSMAVSMVLDRAEASRGIVISDKQARDELDKLISQQLAGGQSDFTRYLSDKGISESDVLSEIKQQLATSRLAQSVTADVKPVTEAQARAFYDAHESQMTSQESRRLLNIVVASKADAERVYRLAKKGTPFESLVATWSQDQSTQASGGDLGNVTRSQLDAAYSAAAFTAVAGGIFGPVQTQYGWNVGKVVAITAPKRVAFPTVEKELIAELSDQAKLRTWNSYLMSLLRGAHVEYAATYRPADPTALPSSLSKVATTGSASDPTTSPASQGATP